VSLFKGKIGTALWPYIKENTKIKYLYIIFKQFGKDNYVKLFINRDSNVIYTNQSQWYWKYYISTYANHWITNTFGSMYIKHVHNSELYAAVKKICPSVVLHDIDKYIMDGNADYKEEHERNEHHEHYEHLFDHVYCEVISGLGYGCLYDGYIQRNDKYEGVTIVKENCTELCKLCTGGSTSETICSEYILNRITCKKIKNWHYVVYKKIEHNLVSFVGEYSVSCALSCMKYLMQAVQSLHNNKIFHLNISPDVIVVYKLNNEFKIKLLDFFLSRDNFKQPIVPLRRHNEYICLSSPELIMHRRDAQNILSNPAAVDTFSLGVLLYFVCTKINTYDRDNSCTHENIMNINYEIDFKLVGVLDEHKKPLWRKVVNSMLNFVPNERVSLHSVLRNPLFWDTCQIDEFLKNNITKIMRSEDPFYNNGIYHDLQTKLKIELHESKTNSRYKCNNDMQLTYMLLGDFPTLLCDLWYDESNSNRAQKRKCNE
jgi:serine/threonine protein kinase